MGYRQNVEAELAAMIVVLLLFLFVAASTIYACLMLTLCLLKYIELGFNLLGNHF